MQNKGACVPSTQSVIRDQTPPSMQKDGGCFIALRLPCKTKADARLRHACHAKLLPPV